MSLLVDFGAGWANDSALSENDSWMLKINPYGSGRGAEKVHPRKVRGKWKTSERMDSLSARGANESGHGQLILDMANPERELVILTLPSLFFLPLSLSGFLLAWFGSSSLLGVKVKMGSDCPNRTHTCTGQNATGLPYVLGPPFWNERTEEKKHDEDR